MKRSIIFLLALTMMLTATACGDEDSNLDPAPTETTTTTATSAAATTTAAKTTTSAAKDATEENNIQPDISTNLVGVWRCVKATLWGEEFTDEDCKENYDKSLGEYFKMEFTDNSKGLLFDGNSVALFYWKKQGNNITLDFDDSNFDSLQTTLTIDDYQLILTITRDGEKSTLYLEKDENAELFDMEAAQKEYIRKTKLKTANSNAFLTYNTVKDIIADIISDGAQLSQIKSQPPIKVSDLDDSNPIQKAVKNELTWNGADNGYVTWEISSSNKIEYVQWAVESDIVGQYPDYETDANAVHTIGEKF